MRRLDRRLVGYVAIVALAGCSPARPTTAECHEAISHFMMLQTQGMPMDPALRSGLEETLANDPDDSFERACHAQATPTQVTCLRAARSVADVKACAANKTEWAWLQPLLDIVLVGERLD